MVNLDDNFAYPKGGSILIHIAVVNVEPPEHSSAPGQHGSMIGEDDQYYAFYIHVSVGLVVRTLPDPAVERLRALGKSSRP